MFPSRGANKAKLSILAFLLLFIPALQYGWCDQGLPQKPVSFAWAFAAQVDNGNVKKIIPVTPKIILRSGDKVKIYFKIEKGAMCMLFTKVAAMSCFYYFQKERGCWIFRHIKSENAIFRRQTDGSNWIIISVLRRFIG